MGIEFVMVHEVLDSIEPNIFHSPRFVIARLTLRVNFQAQASMFAGELVVS